MTDLKPQNRAFYRAALFLHTLLEEGVTHTIISPGSRSTPLTLAAAAMPDLQKHIILDERSAAFTALGIGKATNRPAALICTSGTAVANYYPAVIEARKSGVPLLLLTADRPPHLHKTGANQTINQQHIFGDYPVFFDDLGEQELQEDALSRLAERAAQAFHYSLSLQGPVHLNFPFSKPLEPEQDFVTSVIKDLSFGPSTRPQNADTEDKPFLFTDSIFKEISDAHRPLIIIGQLAPGTPLKHIYRLAERLRAPVLSEQGIAMPEYAIQGFEGLLRSDGSQQELNPDIILRFGRQPAAKSLLQALKKWKPKHHIHLTDTGQPSNIDGTTTDFIDWNGSAFAHGDSLNCSGQWLSKWKQTESRYFEQMAQLFNQTATLTDGQVYHRLVPHIPEQWAVFISNSFPARDQSMFGRWATQPRFTNRGASGIDGITSTAMGVSIGLNQPTILFTGDLAFFHDSNALLNARELTQPVVVVVINNSGGSIFRMLPIADHTNYFTSYFETPQDAAIGKLAEAHGLNHRLISTPKELGQIELTNFTEAGIHILECQTDPDASMEIRNSLWGLR